MTYLEFVGEDKVRGVAESAKFWQVTQNGKNLTIIFGKIGTNGQTTEKSFGSAEEAIAEMEKLIKSKMKKGYKEVKK
jgi:predicted DNA-binding WGR domain protein